MAYPVSDPVTVTVELCDNQFHRLWELRTGVFEGVTRVNEPGQWRVEMHLDEVPRDLLSQIGAVVVRDGTRMLFAGYRRAVDAATGGTTRTVAETERTAAIEGVDCWYWLTSRLVFPNPVTDEPWDRTSDVRAGAGGTKIAEFIDWNADTSALAARQIPNLVVASEPIGTIGEWTGRLDQLSTLVARIADESGLIVEPLIREDRLPRIEVRQASDHTKDVVLTDLADLAEAEQRDVPARSTWVLAGGSGSGASRMFRSAGGGSGLDRIETFTEQSNATTSNELYQIAEAHRRDDGFAFYVSGRTAATATEQYVYVTDYRLGDLVTVQVQGIRFTVPITAVNISVTAERSTETPVLGTYTPDRLRGMKRDLLGLADRFDANIA